MKTIELKRNRKPITIRFTINEKRHIYSTEAQSFVMHNCKKLNIRLNKLDNDWDNCELYYPYEDYFVLLIRKDMRYTQHIVLKEAAKTNIKALVKSLDQKMKECAEYKINQWAKERAAQSQTSPKSAKQNTP